MALAPYLESNIVRVVSAVLSRSNKEKAPVRGLSLCCVQQKAEKMPKVLAETRGFEPPIRVLAPMLP
jgi:hypothetical protein